MQTRVACLGATRNGSAAARCHLAPRPGGEDQASSYRTIPEILPGLLHSPATANGIVAHRAQHLGQSLPAQHQTPLGACDLCPWASPQTHGRAQQYSGICAN